MEGNNTLERKGLKAKFAGLYIVSVGLIVFVVSLLMPRTAPADTITAARPLENANVQYSDALTNIQAVNAEYKKLKQLDQDYSSKVTAAGNAAELNTLNRSIAEAERSFTTKIDNLELVAKTNADQTTANLLRSFAESFRYVMNDRASMKTFKTAAFTNGTANNNQQATLMMQNEIQTRDYRIMALEKQVSSLSNKTIPSTKSTLGNQQEIEVLRNTITTQEQKIANLTATNAALEKEARANSESLDQVKKSTDNNSTASKNQTAMLEKRVSDLNAEIRLVQVDCNLSRVDVTQIISNAKQRKALLADALNTLNTLSAAGDASIKKKVSERINRLNQVASALRD